MDNTVKKEWLSTIDLEKEFGISISSQNKMRMAKKIPYSKFGKKVFYSRSKINALLEGCAIVEEVQHANI
jgi:hypothetical protein